MNYLAHCLLSCSEEDILIGNFMTDFMQKKDELSYDGRILEGIKLHRAIDSYTDKHSASLELRQLLRARHDKYASVVVDLIWDHCLSICWSTYSGTALSSFNENIYEILLRRKSDLPPKLLGKIDSMVRNDFLMAYANEDNMRSSLNWMDNRVKFKSNFVGAIDDIRENRDYIFDLFKNFFPDLIKLSEGFCAC